MVSARDADARDAGLTADGRELGARAIHVDDLYLISGDLDADLRAAVESLVVDPLVQSHTWDDDASAAGGDAGRVVVDVTLRGGVTDSFGSELERAAGWLGADLHVTTGRRFTIEADPGVDTDRLVRRLLANPVIERSGPAGTTTALADDPPPATIEHISLAGLDDDALGALAIERGLSLDLDQMRAVQAHFGTLGRAPTDAELETIAQTWSEHCAHTTFRAVITLDDGTELRPLLAQLRDATDRIAAPFVVSAFVGNAGIVAFTPERTIALKAETHNHPSAVEPFGGANTGVGGVIRDVMGAAHRPIATTDVLCFGPADTPVDSLPDGVLHPRRIANGVVAGVGDYGNKIGLPTVAGAVLYDPGYTANPLVFCGCIGVSSTASAAQRTLDGPHPGDRVVVLGGRTGRDGIRGATFSSRTMDATTGEVSGASVQIGDPIVEKLLIDVLEHADGLYTAITDCGAGGLSSAVGEMAEKVGADIDVSRAPLKYPGLAPWEIWLSEAQERMVVAVAPERLADLRALCERHRVELTDLGAFTGDGRLVVRHGDDVIVDLDGSFLHDGRPSRRMAAQWPTPDRSTDPTRAVDDPADTLLALLSHPNIASKQNVIRTYDHEVRGATVVRPLTGVADDGPADGVVLADPADTHGIAIGIGVNPWYGEIDPERMAHAVVDEAIRNVVAVGADPDRVALLDNFSWGDPRRPSTLGDLGAAVKGCCDAALAYGAPFVSGKDSLNNEYVGSDGERHSVPPTLVITAVAHVPDAGRVVTPDLKAAGNALVLVGPSQTHWGGSHLDLLRADTRAGGEVPPPIADAPERYRRLHTAIQRGLVVACHDVSEGGLAVALAEMAIGGRLGAEITTLPGDDLTAALFGEANGRFVVEVALDALDALIDAVGEPATVIGTVTADPVVRVLDVRPLSVDELRTAWQGGEP